MVLASALRLPVPDLTPFGHDEALEAARARPIWYGARPVDSEITSWWIPDPAGLLYFFALAEAFARPAIARVELVAATNVAAVLLCYGLAHRFFGPGVALAAGLLYAVNPWAATFARQPWVITQPLLTAAMLYSATMVVAARDRRWVFPFFVALAAQTQTHLLAVLCGPPVALTLLLFARRWPVRELAAGCAAASLIVAPFALHLWGMRDGVADALARGNRGLTLAPDGTAATLLVWLVSGYRLDAKLGFPSPALQALQGPLFAVALVTGGLLALGIASCARACLRRLPGWEARAILLIWLLAPLLLMTWQSSAVYIHYILVLLPTPFILIGIGLAGLPSGRLSAGELSPLLGANLASLPPPPANPTSRTPFPGHTVSPSEPPHLQPRSAGRGDERRVPCLGGTPLEHNHVPERKGGSLPLPFPGCGEGSWVSVGRRAGLAGRATGFALGAICAVHVATLGAFYAALDASLAGPGDATPTEWQAALNRAELEAKQLGVGEIHGLPLRYWQSVADRVKEAAVSLVPSAGPDGGRRAVFADLAERAPAGRPDPVPDARARDVVAITGIQDDANRHLDERRKAIDYLVGPELEARFPLEGLTILPGVRDALVLTIPEQELPRAAAREARRLAEIPLPGTSGATRVWLVRARPARELVKPRVRADARFETGVRLLGIDAPPRARPGQGVPLVSYWLVERDTSAPDEDDEPFLELVDRAGAPRAHEARGGLPSRRWRQGDVLVQRANLILPIDLEGGEYRLAAGLSSREGGARARVLDDRGAPIGDSTPVTTLAVR